MTKEERFNSWWYKNTGLATEYPGPQEIAEIVWSRAWDDAADDFRKKLLDLACEVFREGDTQRAKVIRDLSNPLHSLWE